ncbi:hypothetical protein D9M68_800640 [compost metagenome]
MNDAQRQARLMTALQVITEAQDSIQVRTAAAYAHGYIDGLLDEGLLPESAAEDLKRVAMMRRDKRLSDLRAEPV